MPTYAYRCSRCGDFDVTKDMQQTTTAEFCPECGATGRRLFTPPLVRRVTPSLGRALGAQERSASEPRVVQQPPAARRLPTRRPDPRQAALPQP